MWTRFRIISLRRNMLHRSTFRYRREEGLLPLCKNQIPVYSAARFATALALAGFLLIVESSSRSMACQEGSSCVEASSTLADQDIQAAIDCLSERGITMVAIDFDQTLVDIHTGGAWWRDAESILPHIRPQFRKFLKRVQQEGKVSIAIVTFSRQIEVIRACLVEIFGDEASAKGIHIQGYPSFWTGKQQHLQRLPVPMEKILLIDDSQWNILRAKQAGAPAVWFDPDHPDELWGDIRSSLVACDSQ